MKYFPEFHHSCRSILSLIFAFFLIYSLRADTSTDELATPEEIPYYLKKLYDTKLETDRIRFGKIIHDAVVNADLSNKKVVSHLNPNIERMKQAIADNLDRTNIGGKIGWLASAVDYFEKEKLVPIVDVPQSQWLFSQQQSQDGTRLAVFPDKIIVYRNNIPETLVTSSNIHEGIISPDGRRVAFFRLPNEGQSKSEIWVYRTKNKRGRRLAIVPSCYTLLFSLDGGTIYFQEAKKDGASQSRIYRMRATGGHPKLIITGSLLDTVVNEGKYRGCLIIYRRSLSHLGLEGPECGIVVKPSGHLVGKLKGPVCK